MNETVGATNFHVGYDAEEDRLMISVDVASGREYAMALTRRLAKLVLGALADLQTKGRGALGKDPLLRDTVLGFEHGKAVAEAYSSGDTRRRPAAKAQAVPALRVHEAKLTPKPDGGVVLALDDKRRTLTLDLNAQRLHSFMASVLELAERGGWDLPVIAAWLERAESAAASPDPRRLN